MFLNSNDFLTLLQKSGGPNASNIQNIYEESDSLGWNTFTVHTMEQNRTEQNRTEQNRKFLSDNIEYIL